MGWRRRQSERAKRKQRFPATGKERKAQKTRDKHHAAARE